MYLLTDRLKLLFLKKFLKENCTKKAIFDTRQLVFQEEYGYFLQSLCLKYFNLTVKNFQFKSKY